MSRHLLKTNFNRLPPALFLPSGGCDEAEQRHQLAERMMFFFVTMDMTREVHKNNSKLRGVDQSWSKGCCGSVVGG